MSLYNYYIHVVKHNEEILENYQSIISYKLARLNYLMKIVDESNTRAYTSLLYWLLQIYYTADCSSFDTTAAIAAIGESSVNEAEILAAEECPAE